MDYSIYPTTIKYRLLTKRLDELRNCKSKFFKEIVRYISYQECAFSRITTEDRVDHILGCFEVAKELSKYVKERNTLAKFLLNILYRNKGYSGLKIAIILAEIALKHTK